MLGLPPNHMIDKGRNARNFFYKRQTESGSHTFSLKPIDVFSREFGVDEQPSKRYLKGKTLEEVVMAAPLWKRMSQMEIEKELNERKLFIDFLKGVLNLNPIERWTPQHARRHPFIIGNAQPYHNIAPTPPPTSASSYQDRKIQSSSYNSAASIDKPQDQINYSSPTRSSQFAIPSSERPHYGAVGSNRSSVHEDRRYENKRYPSQIHAIDQPLQPIEMTRRPSNSSRKTSGSDLAHSVSFAGSYMLKPTRQQDIKSHSFTDTFSIDPRVKTEYYQKYSQSTQLSQDFMNSAQSSSSSLNIPFQFQQSYQHQHTHQQHDLSPTPNSATSTSIPIPIHEMDINQKQEIRHTSLEFLNDAAISRRMRTQQTQHRSLNDL
jgi:hypothetical protein